jgi:CIC family chloride channel protein
MFLKKIVNKKLLEIDETKLVYILSFVVGFLSALAAAFLKNAIHFIHTFLTEGIIAKSGSYLYLAYPMFGMLLTLLFVKYLVKDDISHGVSKILYAISRKKGYIKAHNTWSSIVASTLTIGFGGSVGA